MNNFTRPTLDPVDSAAIPKLIGRVPKIPGAMTLAAGKLLLENKKRIEQLQDLREQRGFVPLKEDPNFMTAWDAIDSAAQREDAHAVLRLCLRENILLTKEINIHRRALGLELIKVHRA
jgi:hypothetical protein